MPSNVRNDYKHRLIFDAIITTLLRGVMFVEYGKNKL